MKAPANRKAHLPAGRRRRGSDTGRCARALPAAGVNEIFTKQSDSWTKVTKTKVDMQSDKFYYTRRAVQEESRLSGAVSDRSRERHLSLAREFRARSRSEVANECRL